MSCDSNQLQARFQRQCFAHHHVITFTHVAGMAAAQRLGKPQGAGQVHEERECLALVKVLPFLDAFSLCQGEANLSEGVSGCWAQNPHPALAAMSTCRGAFTAAAAGPLWRVLLETVFHVQPKPRRSLATAARHRQGTSQDAAHGPPDVTAPCVAVRSTLYDAREWGRFRTWYRRGALPVIPLAGSLPFTVASLPRRPLLAPILPRSTLPSDPGKDPPADTGEDLALYSPWRAPGLQLSFGVHHKEDCSLHGPPDSGLQTLRLRFIAQNMHPTARYAVDVSACRLVPVSGAGEEQEGELQAVEWRSPSATAPKLVAPASHQPTTDADSVCLGYGQSASGIIGFRFPAGTVEPAALERCKALLVPVAESPATPHQVADWQPVSVPFIAGDAVWKHYTYMPGGCLTLGAPSDLV